jgi:hypothetical protein
VSVEIEPQAVESEEHTSEPVTERRVVADVLIRTAEWGEMTVGVRVVGRTDIQNGRPRLYVSGLDRTDASHDVWIAVRGACDLAWAVYRARWPS